MEYLTVSTGIKTDKQRENNVDAKILILGAKGVGKSALVVRYLTRRFIGDYDNTYDARYLSTANFNDSFSKIEIYDPRARSLDTEEMLISRILWAHAFVFVYSVVDVQSFNEIYNLYKLVKKIRTRDNVPIVIVANKMDLCRIRKVSKEEGQRLSSRIGCTYYETSAAVLNEGYNSIFDAIKEIGEIVVENRSRRRASDGMMRRRSLSPRPLRSAFVKMFGRPTSRIL